MTNTVKEAEAHLEARVEAYADFLEEEWENQEWVSDDVPAAAVLCASRSKWVAYVADWERAMRVKRNDISDWHRMTRFYGDEDETSTFQRLWREEDVWTLYDGIYDSDELRRLRRELDYDLERRRQRLDGPALCEVRHALLEQRAKAYEELLAEEAEKLLWVGDDVPAAAVLCQTRSDWVAYVVDWEELRASDDEDDDEALFRTLWSRENVRAAHPDFDLRDLEKDLDDDLERLRDGFEGKPTCLSLR